MAQAVSRRSLTAEARIQSRVSPCGICGGQSGTETGFSRSTLVFPCQFHSTGRPLHGKTKKLIIFITGLHNKLQGCGASVASAAGPFKKKAIILLLTNSKYRYGRAMAQAVSRRPLTAETRVRSRVSSCEICGGQSGTGTGFSPSCRFPLPISFHWCAINCKTW
jgi:hypothetical protein